MSGVPDLDGLAFHVAATATDGVVDARTRLDFRQVGRRVTARYAGGRVRRGRLVGAFEGDVLAFRYAQVEEDGALHAGRSHCAVETREDGRLRIVEHFRWTTRDGAGVNVFEPWPPSGR